MVFSSVLFLFRFLPLVLLCYFLVPAKWRNGVLFLFSLGFYAWGEPIYVVLMLFSTVVDYITGGLTGYFRERNKGIARLFVALSVLVNVSLLGFFKYTNFFISTWNDMTNQNIALLELALPIGISFYTFQTMSYTIDVYRGEAKVQKNILNFGTYVALFPQLIAGPIVRYQTIAEELDHRNVTLEDVSGGIFRFVMGLGKKVLIANNIGLIWEQIAFMKGEQLSAATAWLGIVAFGLQIYFDFSGYSDMAIGLGRIFGFHFMENFRYPYESKSITEFWQRWHISLGTWFREYVYIPLGGNRKGLSKQIRNLAIVWVLTGFWHGASWNFILWGVYFGVLLIIEKSILLPYMDRIPNVVKHLYVLLLLTIGWCMFTYSDMAHGMEYVRALVGHGGKGVLDRQAIYMFYSNVVVFLLAAIGATSLPVKLVQRIKENHRGIVQVCSWIWMVGVLLLSVAYMVDASYNPFLYFRF